MLAGRYPTTPLAAHATRPYLSSLIMLRHTATWDWNVPLIAKAAVAPAKNVAGEL